MNEHVDVKDSKEYKSMKNTLYQKKSALQEIYNMVKNREMSPEEILRLVETLCKVAGVYIPKEDF